MGNNVTGDVESLREISAATPTRLRAPMVDARILAHAMQCSKETQKQEQAAAHPASLVNSW